MNLYLHAGLNKTGSSFLQTNFAKNREICQSNGFFSPRSKKFEQNMLDGKITPGNGHELYLALINEDKNKTATILKNYFQNAQVRNCQNVLISNERLFVIFADEPKLDLFLKICKEQQFENINVLIFLRDPASHIMSMYKHRSKSGHNSNFEEWLQRDYETVHILKKLSIVHDKYPINWTFRKYRKNSEFMLETTFTDWLGLPSPQGQSTHRRVNHSLQLSEIILLQTIYKKNPYLTSCLRKQLLALSPSDKADDSDLEFFYRDKANIFLEPFKPIYEEINKLLPSDEKLNWENNSDAQGTDVTVLSRTQMHCIATAIADSQKTTNRIKHHFSAIKALIKKHT